MQGASKPPIHSPKFAKTQKVDYKGDFLMTWRSSDIKHNMDLFEELLTCGSNIYTWTYDSEGTLLSSNCPHLVLDKIFISTGCKGYMLDQAASPSRPLILSAKLGLMWACAYENSPERTSAIYVIGPVFNTGISTAGITEAINQPHIPYDFRPRFREILQEMPVVSSVLFFQYALMLHYCATGEKLSRSELNFQADYSEAALSEDKKGDRHQTWMAEQMLLKNVREGDLNYQSDLERAGLLSSGVRISTDTPLTQVIITEAVFTSLCTRAAIEGGMSPETAYSLGDSYIQSMSGSKSITELQNLGHMMYEEFINRVHHIRTTTRYSAQIQACRDYIQLHPSDDLSIELLADKVGYSPYYLSRKFKDETGSGLNDYIKQVRIDKAKSLLSYTTNTISSIAEELHFCSGSHFSDTFRRITGMLPLEYREKTRKL